MRPTIGYCLKLCFVPASFRSVGLLIFGMWPLRVFGPCCLFMIDLKTLKCSGISLNFALIGFCSINTLKSSVEVKIIWPFFRFMSTLTACWVLAYAREILIVSEKVCVMLFGDRRACQQTSGFWALDIQKISLLMKKWTPVGLKFFSEFKEIHVTGRTEWNVKQNKTKQNDIFPTKRQQRPAAQMSRQVSIPSTFSQLDAGEMA